MASLSNDNQDKLIKDKPKYQVLFVSSELHPFSKTGGLGDVSNSLPKALMALDQDIRILVPGYSFALENDKQKPINIESSQAEADYKNGTTTYTGNVLLTQGSLKIQADQLIIYRGDKRVGSIVSKGLPAKFQQQPFVNKPPVYASALTITYDLSKEILLLEGDVFIELDGSTHQGERYEYNLQNQMLSAVGDGENRVKVTFDPTVVQPLLDLPGTNKEYNSEDLEKIKDKLSDHLETPASGQKPVPQN